MVLRRHSCLVIAVLPGEYRGTAVTLPCGKALYKSQVLLHHHLLEIFRGSAVLALTWLYIC